jgi:hypothetical protein
MWSWGCDCGFLGKITLGKFFVEKDAYVNIKAYELPSVITYFFGHKAFA